MPDSVKSLRHVFFFISPPDAPFLSDTLGFQDCLDFQVGSDLFHFRRSFRLVTVETESRSIAVLSLKDPSCSPVLTLQDPYLNSCEGAVLVPRSILIGNRSYKECSIISKLILAEQSHSILSVTCYILPASLKLSSYCLNTLRSSIFSRSWKHRLDLALC